MRTRRIIIQDTHRHIKKQEKQKKVSRSSHMYTTAAQVGTHNRTEDCIYYNSKKKKHVKKQIIPYFINTGTGVEENKF